MDDGFFRSLFDISFTNFITTKIIKFVYVLALVLIALFALIFTVTAFLRSPVFGLFVLLIIAPLSAFLYVVYTRIVLEVIIQIFRINEHLRDQIHMQQTAFANAGWLNAPPPPPPMPAAAAAAPPVWTPAAAPPPPPPPRATNQCPNCGAQSAPGQRFCRSCGTPLA